MDVDSVLPFGDGAKKRARKEKESLIELIKKAMKNGIGITTDMWNRAVTIRVSKPKSRHSKPQTCLAV